MIFLNWSFQINTLICFPQEGTQEDFGNSWHYPLPEDMGCRSNETAGPHPCDGNENRTVAEGYCSIITNTSGKMTDNIPEG